MIEFTQDVCNLSIGFMSGVLGVAVFILRFGMIFVLIYAIKKLAEIWKHKIDIKWGRK